MVRGHACPSLCQCQNQASRTWGMDQGCLPCDFSVLNCVTSPSVDCSQGPLTRSISCLLMSNSLCPHGLYPARLLCPWDFPGKNTGVCCHVLLQGIFPTQELNLGLLHCRQTLYRRSHQGSPFDKKVENYNLEKPRGRSSIQLQLPQPAPLWQLSALCPLYESLLLHFLCWDLSLTVRCLVPPGKPQPLPRTSRTGNQRPQFVFQIWVIH